MAKTSKLPAVVTPSDVRVELALRDVSQEQLALWLDVDPARISRLLHRSLTTGDQEILDRAMAILRNRESIEPT